VVSIRRSFAAVALFVIALLAAAFLAPRVRADEAASSEPPLSPEDRNHWSFRPLSHPAPPEVRQADWPRNAIDRFILAGLEAAGIGPSPPANRVTLIRRVTLDLTGLPPEPEAVEAFVSDDRPDAYERLLDRLLASPAHGERWAQHWLDLARFAETDGFEHDHVRPTAWKYRDWVIQALNADLPYDEFVRLQIAGDLLRPGDEQAAVATGFVLAGPDMPDINLEEERRQMVLADIAATVGSVFLGLQTGCAQCHDHKFDPISQADFYRLQAFFAPAVHFEKQDHEAVRALREAAADDRPECHLLERGDFRRPGPRVEPAYPRIANPWDDRPAGSDEGRPPPRVELARWLTRPDHPLATRVIVNRLWQHHFGAPLVGTPSDFGIMGDLPTHPELLDWLAAELPRQGWSLKRMHRLLLSSATYRQASRLSDASDSDDLQRAAREAWERAAQKDPENRLLWRARRQRLEGEAIRDCLLAVAGQLSPRAGGPGVRPPLPAELVGTLLRDQWNPSPDEVDHRRRSVYLFARRNLRYPLFEVFDRPDTNASCPRRARSTIAPQALTLLNSGFSWSCARDLAALVQERAGSDPAACVDLAYRRALGRPPSAAEQQRARRFLAEQADRRRATPGAQAALSEEPRAGEDPLAVKALALLCLGLVNTNEFVYVD
jgi:hypothetical protein